MSNKNWSSEDLREKSPIVEREEAEDNASVSSSEKNRSKFSLLKKNLKKNFKMSSKEKSLENVSEITGGKKKKSKKSKDKTKNLPKQSTSTTEQEPSTSSEKKSKGSVVRKLSLDKLYSNIKGGSKSKDDKGRRSTTPDIASSIETKAMSLKDELQQAESKFEPIGSLKNYGDPTLEESEPELSEDYRTPVCQSPVGSYIYDATSQSMHDPTIELLRDVSSEISSTNEIRTDFLSSSDPSLESAIQSGTTTPRSDVDQRNKTSEPFSKETTYAKILSKFDSNSSSMDEKEEINSKNFIESEKQSNLQELNSTPVNQAQSISNQENVNATSTAGNTTSTNKETNFEESHSSFISKEKEDAEEANKNTNNDTITSVEFPNNLPEREEAMAEPNFKNRESFSSEERATQASSEKRECLFKILVIGELGTGKTSIIKRYVHEFFSQHYRATIGVDFALKVLNWDQDTVIRLQLWDIAGQERFGNMTRVYYKEAVGAFIVFDVTRAATFDAVLKWKQDLDSKVQLPNGSPIPCVLLANKCDQPKEGPVNHPEKIQQFCKENSFSDWFETSAKENINIDKAAKSLVTKILQNDKLSQNGKESRDTSKFPLDGKDTKSSQEKSCAC